MAGDTVTPAGSPLKLSVTSPAKSGVGFMVTINGTPSVSGDSLLPELIETGIEAVVASGGSTVSVNEAVLPVISSKRGTERTSAPLVPCSVAVKEPVVANCAVRGISISCKPGTDKSAVTTWLVTPAGSPMISTLTVPVKPNSTSTAALKLAVVPSTKLKAVRLWSTVPSILSALTPKSGTSTTAVSMAVTAASPMDTPPEAGVPVTVPVLVTVAFTVTVVESVCDAPGARAGIGLPTAPRISSARLTLRSCVSPVLVTT